MKNHSRRISLIAVVAALVLLVAVRSMPHHHCGSAGEDISFGTEECGGHGGCDNDGGDSHSGGALLCCGDVDFYLRSQDSVSDIIKRGIEPLLPVSLPGRFLLSVQPVSMPVLCEECIFRLQSVPLLQQTLRAPPAA